MVDVYARYFEKSFMADYIEVAFKSDNPSLAGYAIDPDTGNSLWPELALHNDRLEAEKINREMDERAFSDCCAWC